MKIRRIEDLFCFRVDEQGGLGRHVEPGGFLRLRGLGFLGLDRRLPFTPPPRWPPKSGPE